MGRGRIGLLWLVLVVGILVSCAEGSTRGQAATSLPPVSTTGSLQPTTSIVESIDTAPPEEEIGPPASSTGSIYERLDLSTTDSAIAALSTAYEVGDFVAVFLILDRESQATISEGAWSLRSRPVTRADYQMGFSLAELDFYSTPEFLFDAWMDEARVRRQLRFELGGEYSIAGKEVGPPLEDGRTTTLAEVDFDDHGKFRFLLAQAPSGRWRVVSVAAAGSIPEPGRPFVVATSQDQYGYPICSSGLVVFDAADCDLFVSSPFSDDPLADQLEALADLAERRPSTADAVRRRTVELASLSEPVDDAAICRALQRPWQYSASELLGLPETHSAFLAEHVCLTASRHLPVESSGVYLGQFLWSKNPLSAYGMLELGTADVAALTFMRAFSAEDYMSAYLVLSRDAQQRAFSPMANGSFAGLLPPDHRTDFVAGAEHDPLSALGNFQAVVSEASRLDGYWAGDLDWLVARAKEDERGVVVTLAAAAQEVDVLVSQSVRGDWRVEAIGVVEEDPWLWYLSRDCLSILEQTVRPDTC